MIRPFAMILVPAVAFAACAGKQDAATPAADSTAVAPTVVDSAMAAPVDSTAKSTADTAAKPAAATKATTPKQETGGYDQPIKPRFKIDEKTGKVDTIKKP